MTDAWYDDEDIYTVQVECPCGSDLFYYVGPEQGVPLFTIDDLGQPLDAIGHPICAKCGMDWPLLVEDPETGEWIVLDSGDLVYDDEDQEDDFEGEE